jgi:hypothetical protein
MMRKIFEFRISAVGAFAATIAAFIGTFLGNPRLFIYLMIACGLICIVNMDRE